MYPHLGGRFVTFSDCIGHACGNEHLEQGHIHHLCRDHHGNHDKSEDNALSLKLILRKDIACGGEKDHGQQNEDHRQKQGVEGNPEDVHLLNQDGKVLGQHVSGDQPGRCCKNGLVGVGAADKHEVEGEQGEESGQNQ